MKEELIQALESFGLSLKESNVWLACLELGQSTAYDISMKTRLPRTLVYDILERLIDLTLVSVTIKDNKKYFKATSPKRLIEILKDKEQSIQKVMPILENLQKVEGTKIPEVEIYEGKEGMKAILEDILKSNVKEFLRYGSARVSFDILPIFMEKWTKERIKLKIRARYIYDDTKEAREKIKVHKEALKLVQYRFLPTQLESPTAILIYSDKIVFSLWTKELFAVLIKSKELAENQKKYFEKLWLLAKK